MMPNHHLSDATLMSYAAGNSPTHLALVIAAHLDQCPLCRQKLRDMEAIAGSVLTMGATQALSEDALQVTMAQLDGLTQIKNDADTSRSQAVNDNMSDLPSLKRFLPDGGLDHIVWKNLAPGIKTHIFPQISPEAGTVRLLKIAPGMTLPLHDHQGDELTMVLKGSYSDEIGRFKAGDVADLAEGITHQPISDTDQDCICLIATEGPLRFKAMVPRIMQYFIGI